MLLIHNARILTMAGQEIENGYIWLDKPLIKAIGSGDVPESVMQEHKGETIDAAGGFVLPGLIDAHCHLGLFNDGLTEEGSDGNESADPVTPQMRAIDGLFQDDRAFSEALEAGVTTVMTGPGSANIICGTFALLHTNGRSVEQMLIHQPAAVKAALGENPKKAHGRKERSPKTRMANAAVMRGALQKARHYARQKELAASDESKMPAPDDRWEALLPVLAGQIPLKIHAHRNDDILTAVRLANEFGLRYTLDHCSEGYLIADLLADEYAKGQAAGHGSGQPGKGRLEGIITGPIISDRSKPELVRASIENTARLTAAGLPVAIMTDHPVVPQHYLALSAAATCKGGMSAENALAGITITAAKILGIANERGSLEAGKQADLVLFTEHPFDYRSRTCLVLLDGEIAYRDLKA